MTTSATSTQPETVQHLIPLLEKLTLEQKAALVQGADFWTTVPLPEIGLRAMTLSDGPAGVRGPRWDEREPSLNMPSGSALAASWDVELAYRYGAAAASEARRKDVDVVLGPTINLHRSPLGGRHFECFSEDPELSAELAAAYVRGLQDNGVAATPKHYVANDSETDRFTVDVRVDERALRELYLAPFERAVEAGAWSVMSAYNAVDGVTMTENDLLETPLNSEWGFDGVVVSDWTAVRSPRLDPRRAGPRDARPGAGVGRPRRRRSATAACDEADLDRKVLRMLLLAERVGALGGSARDRAGRRRRRARSCARPPPRVRCCCATTASCRWMPRPCVASPSSATTPAMRAPRAAAAPPCCPSTSSRRSRASAAPCPAPRSRYELGAVVQEGVAELPLETITNPVTGEPGRAGHVPRRRRRRDVRRGPPRDRARLVRRRRPRRDRVDARARDDLHAAETGEILLGFAGSTRGRVFVDGELVLDDTPVITGTDLGAAFLNPPSVDRAPHRRRRALRSPCARSSTIQSDGALAGVLSATFGIAPDDSDPDGAHRPRGGGGRGMPMSRSSSSAPTPRSNPRATTARTSTCPDARTTSSAPSSRRTRARSSSSTPARPWCCRGPARSPRCCRATSAASSSAPRSPTSSPARSSPAGACPRPGPRRSPMCRSPT